jgi:transposase
MSVAFIEGVTESLPNARITFDKFQFVAHAFAAVDQMRHLEQQADPSLNGLRRTLFKDRDHLSVASLSDLDTLIARQPASTPHRLGSTVNICAKFPTASRSTSPPACSGNGGPRSWVPRSSR